MCLIAWNWQPASPTPLLLIANRDEYYARPTAPLHWWEDAGILAGRDLQAIDLFEVSLVTQPMQPLAQVHLVGR